MKVWVVEVDLDGTTRSVPHLHDIYATEEAAHKAVEAMELAKWQYAHIIEWEVEE